MENMSINKGNQNTQKLIRPSIMKYDLTQTSGQRCPNVGQTHIAVRGSYSLLVMRRSFSRQSRHQCPVQVKQKYSWEQSEWLSNPSNTG